MFGYKLWILYHKLMMSLPLCFQQVVVIENVMWGFYWGWVWIWKVKDNYTLCIFILTYPIMDTSNYQIIYTCVPRDPEPAAICMCSTRGGGWQLIPCGASNLIIQSVRKGSWCHLKYVICISYTYRVIKKKWIFLLWWSQFLTWIREIWYLRPDLPKEFKSEV